MHDAMIHPWLLQTLRQRQPELYSDSLEIAIGDGWVPLLYRLGEAYLARCREEGRAPRPYAQIKEKFGGLRVYWLPGDLLQAGIEESRRTCEVCGDPGTLRCQERHGGYVNTTCERHAAWPWVELSDKEQAAIVAWACQAINQGRAG